MDKYNEFKDELSVYENKSKSRVMLAIFIHKFFRAFTTKTFDFVISLVLITSIPMFIFGFDVNIFVFCVMIHFVYWVLIYKPLSKYFKSNMHEEFTLRIRILEEIISRK